MMGTGDVGAARSARWILVTGGVFMALATICGALGAHALPGRLTAGQLEIYDTGVRFQFFQALGLLVLGTVARGGYSDGLRAAAWLLVGGIVTFCGSLYLLAFHITLGAPLVVGLTTPLGGILLIAGWVMFAVTSWRLRRAA
ncbi:MAG TPA: DUF423 domain-containing protein [Steroidobacteraceae bacterium]